MWEFDATLKRGNSGSFRLAFETPEIIDRAPTPGQISLRGLGDTIVLSDTVTLQVQPPSYPEPPSDIALNPDARTMHQRYLGYRSGREPLASMANFCLTVLEASTGKRKGSRAAAARIYNIDKRILDKIGELSAHRGGTEARKADGVATEFSSEERHFLDRALKTIIRRVAQRELTPKGDLPQISWSDLPPIESRAKRTPKSGK